MPTDAPTIEISPNELAAAVPIRSAPRVAVSQNWNVPPREEPRLCRLAVWAFVVAVLGIPLFGVVTGLLAIILGSAALSAMAGTRMRGTGWAVGALLLGVGDIAGWVIGLGLWFGVSPPLELLSFNQPDAMALEGLSPAIGRAMRANVLIEVERGRALFHRRGIGSGVILQIADGQALVMTNRHVVAAGAADIDGTLDQLNASTLTVSMVGQLPQTGRVVWAAPPGVDAALVRVRCDSSEARVADWAPGEPLHVGDPVFAIGNPHNLGWTHTQGTISQFRTQDVGTQRMQVIQTQTAINPGNSGGGLYTHAGKLIGINTWTNDKRTSEGISFAIALDSILAEHPAGLRRPTASDKEPASP